MKSYVKSPAEFTISACTIAKNEEKTIATSINSYKEYVDQIIIVDTGSTDDTVRIAESLGAKVLHFDWCDDFAAAKNIALDAVTCDWIVFLDADEYFADDTCKDLRTAIFAANLQNRNAIGCRMENIDIDSGEVSSEAFSIRVFKAVARYRYAIHEEIRMPGGITLLSVDKTYYYLKHTGYSKNISARKSERNLPILLKELKIEKDEKRIIAYYSYISDAYFTMGKYKESCEYAKKYIVQSKKTNIILVGCEIKPYFNIINSLEFEKAEQESIKPYVLEYESRYPDSSDAAFSGGRSCMRDILFNEALKKFDNALKLSENFKGTYIDTVGPHKAVVYNCCGVCEESSLNSVQAMDWYFKALQETEDYQVAAFNLLRVVRGMPQQEINSLVEPLYLGASKKRQVAIMSALMCNYMVPQIVKCYAAYRSEKQGDTLYADVTAFVMAGKGKYAEASKLFILNYSANKNKEVAMRSLLCSVLSDDKELISQSLEICNPVQAFALGLSEKPELTIDDIFDIATVYIECSHLGQIDFANKKIDTLADKLNDKQLMRLSSFLAHGFAIESALCVIQHASISADSVFMQGYCLYRMRRLYEAVEFLLLAKHMGYDKPSFDEIYGNITVIREKSASEPQIERITYLKVNIEQKIEAGDLNGAATDIETYMRVAEPDTGILAAQATLLYYRGEYKKAAIAAECGLLKDESNFDLLYNAGCVYEKLGDSDRAKAMYLKALKNCKDSDIANELNQILGVTN